MCQNTTNAKIQLMHLHATFVNVAADFTSVVETHKPLGGHDGCEIRRYIHKDLA
jgi:hypothetical protein